MQRGPAFITINVIILALLGAAWRAGFFSMVGLFQWHEIAMLIALFTYASIGLVAAGLGKWQTATYIANGIPMWALTFTVLGLLMGAGSLKTLNPEEAASVFRELVFAIAPNGAGVLLMSWIRELAWWCAGEQA